MRTACAPLRSLYRPTDHARQSGAAGARELERPISPRPESVVGWCLAIVGEGVGSVVDVRGGRLTEPSTHTGPSGRASNSRRLSRPQKVVSSSGPNSRVTPRVSGIGRTARGVGDHW